MCSVASSRDLASFLLSGVRHLAGGVLRLVGDLARLVLGGLRGGVSVLGI